MFKYQVVSLLLLYGGLKSKQIRKIGLEGSLRLVYFKGLTKLRFLIHKSYICILRTEAL